jgi:thiol:disulfide interchange protein
VQSEPDQIEAAHRQGGTDRATALRHMRIAVVGCGLGLEFTRAVAPLVPLALAAVIAAPAATVSHKPARSTEPKTHRANLSASTSTNHQHHHQLTDHSSLTN